MQRLRLLLFRDGAYDGFTHDIAATVDHIGGRIGKDVGGKLSRLTVEVKIHILIRSAFLGQYVLRLGNFCLIPIQRKGVHTDECAVFLCKLFVQRIQLPKLAYAGTAGGKPEIHHGYCIPGKQLVTLDRVSIQILAFKGRKLLYTAILRGACLGTVPRDTRFTVHGLLHDLRIFLLQLRQLVFYLADLFSRGFEQLIFFVRKLIFDILYRVQQKISVVFSVFQHG